MTETFYEVLGVSTDASTAAIEAAYRERLKETHPDVSDAADAGEATQRLIEARDVLTDEDERARYDRVGHDAYVAGESDIADGGGSDAAEAARRAGYDGSASAGDRAEASTDRSTSRTSARERARRERAARDRVAEDRHERSTDDTEASSSDDKSSETTSETATASESDSGWQSGTTATSGFSDNAGGGATWSSSSAYSVRQTDTPSRGSLLEKPTGRGLTLFAITFALYPVMLFSALLPAFPLWVNLTIGVCTLFMIGYLQSEPTIAIMVFGSWSLTTTVLLVTLNISAFSLIGALALSGTWLPFGLSLLTASVLRL
ncbi:DnaJ domain-containing protein [Haloarcula sp. KBTZ06]|uniref:J domain-containing protein n=1 Tax=unclassified Haloarcula TaxID=2624677 RepID=UPI0007BBE0D8|nr:MULTISPECIES: DnaJ domain-containing protein [unclassified Haloarcula]KZX48561.1 molecular chaperone DnaJ [Haloarcula sp. K1]MUV49140.1 DnaJ domain-containing protein [Haloarcula sp. CBA1122]